MLRFPDRYVAGAAVAASILIGSVAAAGAQDVQDAKKLYLTRTCVACHGKDGAKAIQTYPNLAGLDKTYLFSQMQDIASGKRVSGPDARGYPRTQAMKDIMGVVSAEELKTIAAWLSTLPPPAPKPGDPALVAAGAQVYTKSACQSCHGKEGIKPLPGYPVIGGQKKEYLLLQIKEIRDGIRDNGRAKLMRPMVKNLTDDQINQLTDYLAQVDRTAVK